MEAPTPPTGEAVALDLGVARMATLSDGRVFPALNVLRRRQVRLTRLQRALARKTKGSHNRAKARAKIAKLHWHVAAARRDHLHKISTELSKNHAKIVLEDLTVRAMTGSARGTVEEPGRNVRQKAGLNRSILEQGWGEFRRQLEYKTKWRGGELILVPAAHTSQTCPNPECRHVAAENRPSQAHFACVACGHTGHADDVAATNILRAGLARSACGGAALAAPVKQESIRVGRRKAA